MPNPLFDPRRCGLANIPKVSFDFVPDCEVLPAPPPIFDCPEVAIPVVIPGVEGQVGSIGEPGAPGCDPTFTILGTSVITIPFGGAPIGHVTIVQDELDPCDVGLSFALRLPGGEEVCTPSYTLGDVIAESIDYGIPPTGHISVRPASYYFGSDCAYSVNLQFYIPKGRPGCTPTLQVETTDLLIVPFGTPASGAVTITAGSEVSASSSSTECLNYLHFNFYLPATDPTPTNQDYPDGCMKFVWCAGDWVPDQPTSLDEPPITGQYLGEALVVCDCSSSSSSSSSSSDVPPTPCCCHELGLSTSVPSYRFRVTAGCPDLVGRSVPLTYDASDLFVGRLLIGPASPAFPLGDNWYVDVAIQCWDQLEWELEFGEPPPFETGCFWRLYWKTILRKESNGNEGGYDEGYSDFYALLCPMPAQELEFSVDAPVPGAACAALGPSYTVHGFLEPI